MSNLQQLPVAVIGAGPVGLAAAAHLIKRGLQPVIFELGAEVASSMRQWAHVRLFSPYRITLDAAAVELLEQSGWQAPDAEAIPTGGDLIDGYLQPLAALPAINTALRVNTRVTAISRQRTDKLKDAHREDAPFVIRFITTAGVEDQLLAQAVIDASGTWTQPNPMGADGLPAVGESASAAHIAYGIPDITGRDFNRYANKRVMVVGGGHSAINALLELTAIISTAPQTRVIWVMRKDSAESAYGGQNKDALPARGLLGVRIREMVEAGYVQVRTPFYVQRVENSSASTLTVTGETPHGTESVLVDEVIVATGFRPDHSFTRELRLELDPSLETTPRLAPLIDPNIHSCGTVPPHGEAELRQPEKNFYIVGMKSYGRAPTFLLATGYEQVRSVAAALAGDWEAARRVELVLPETGVCSTDSALGSSCCGTGAAIKQSSSLVALADIPVYSAVKLDSVNARVQTVALQTSTRECGCDDTCCANGVHSSTCGCDASCC